MGMSSLSCIVMSPMLVFKRTLVALSSPAADAELAATASNRMLTAKYDLNCIIEIC
jgi:hypothetical protein